MNSLVAGAAIFRIKTAELIQYRAAWLSNAATGFFWGVIEVTVYRVFFLWAANREAVNTAAFTLPQMVSYIWLLQALLALAPFNVDSDILDKINNGDIGVELCRPMDLYVHWFAKSAAGRLAPLLWRGLPVLLAGLCMPAGWRLGGPSSAAGLALMLLSCVFSLFLCSAYATLVAAIRMNVKWGDGPMYMILLLGMMFSGMYLPLQLWPDFLQQVLLFQPFAGYLDIPLRLYIGTMPPGGAWLGISLQAVWTLVFITVGRLLMASRLRKTVVQGG